MNVKRLYEYTVKSFITQASYCCTHDVENTPWILGASLDTVNCISIWLDRDDKDLYNITLSILSDKSGYIVKARKQYKIFKYAKTKQKRALYPSYKCPN